MKIIRFNAVWCPGCLVMKKRWKEVLNNYPSLEIINYDYDLDTLEVNNYQVGKILPVAIFMDGDMEIKRVVGEVSTNFLLEVIKKIEGNN